MEELQKEMSKTSPFAFNDKFISLFFEVAALCRERCLTRDEMQESNEKVKERANTYYQKHHLQIYIYQSIFRF